ncbi:hypothetical protein HAX54_018116 [Datura stramonium]|uniref:Uncharacterized protein n=1 Tax=Datura stramonium TaxID=4076 RepID=A0ABS8UMX3_DATST|nr:hypothetical protein [Datura stramonium]
MRSQVILFTTRTFNAFLGMLAKDAELYFQLNEKPPYKDILHTLCGENAMALWTRSDNDTHPILPYSYLYRAAKVWYGIEEEEANLQLPLAGHLVGELIDVAKLKKLDIVTAPTLTQAKCQARDNSWRVRTTFVEPLDDDEPIVLTNEVDEDDATTSTIMVDDIDDVDG